MVVIISQKYIGSNACMSTVAVWEWMNLNQTVMKSSRCLQGCVDGIFCPMAGIVQMHANLHGNVERIDTNVFFTSPVATCPVPDVAE